MKLRQRVEEAVQCCHVTKAFLLLALVVVALGEDDAILWIVFLAMGKTELLPKRQK